MIRYEYFQETSESITDDNWKMLLDKHGSQGWELSSIVNQDVYEIDHKKDPDAKIEKSAKNMQTLYLVIFRRGY